MLTWTRRTTCGGNIAMMMQQCLTSFEDPAWHAEVMRIIRRHSTNRTDVREEALRGIDLSRCRSVMDLGCGFGFMTEAVVGKIAPGARVVGIDACPANERPYLECVSRAGCSGTFLCRCLDDRLEFPDRAFDLVVASYSIYFFPGIIPDIRRVLRPGGRFVALTHTEDSCRDLLHLLGDEDPGSRLLVISRNFSAESARRKLDPWFRDLDRVDHRNTLVFEQGGHEDLLDYIRFKMPFLYPDWVHGGEVSRERWRFARRRLTRMKRIVLVKDDAAFRGRRRARS